MSQLSLTNIVRKCDVRKDSFLPEISKYFFCSSKIWKNILLFLMKQTGLNLPGQSLLVPLPPCVPSFLVSFWSPVSVFPPILLGRLGPDLCSSSLTSTVLSDPPPLAGKGCCRTNTYPLYNLQLSKWTHLSLWGSLSLHFPRLLASTRYGRRTSVRRSWYEIVF